MSTPQPTVGNQPTESVSAVHRVLADLRQAVTGLNGEVQQELLRLHDDMTAALDKLFHRSPAEPAGTVTAPPVVQVAQPGTDAHAEGEKLSVEAVQAAEQERQAAEEERARAAQEQVAAAQQKAAE